MFDQAMLESKFGRIGARMKIAEARRRQEAPIAFDIRNDRDGEYFEVICRPNAAADVEVLDVQPANRHLLLMVREEDGKHKYLCGHDERHWFVAAVPENTPVGTVRTAMEALKPPAVREAQARKGLRQAEGNRRKNAAYRRQGEWFFIPAPHLRVAEKLILLYEPISRGNGGKPHWCEFCYRTGGETVYVCRQRPSGLLEADYRRLIDSDDKAKDWDWRVMRRNAEVYVRGRVRHSDHKTITLHGWHQVLMNTESQAKAMRNVVFLD